MNRSNKRSIQFYAALIAVVAVMLAALGLPTVAAAAGLQVVAGDGRTFYSYSSRLDLARAHYSLNISGGVRPYSFSFSKTGIVEIVPDYPGAQVAFKVKPKAVGTTVLTVRDTKGNSLVREIVVYDSKQLPPPPLRLGVLPDAGNPVAVGQGRGFGISGGKPPYTVAAANPGIARIEVNSSRTVWFVWGVAAGTTQITVTDAAGARVQGTVHVGTTKPLIVTADASLLPNGKGELIISSGNPAYTVSASGNIAVALKGTDSYGRTVYTLTAKAPGQGTVTVRDAKGQTASKTITVKDWVTLSFPQLTGAQRTIDVGQTTRLTVTGGTAPYTVTVDQPALVSIQQQAPGQYNVTGRQAGVANITAKDAGGAVRTLSLTVRALPVLTLAAPDTLMLGTTGSLSLIGGAAPFAVTVSGNQLVLTKVDEKKYTLTPKAAGRVVITVKDGKGTTMQKTISVIAPQLRAEFATMSLEKGQSGVCDVKGGVAPYTVTLSNGNATVKLLAANPSYTRYEITGAVPGTVNLNIRDAAGATAVYSLTIRAPQVKLRIMVSSDTLKLGATGAAAVRAMTIEGGIAPYTVAVSSPIIELVKISATQYRMIPKAKGTATILVRDRKGAFDTQVMKVE